MTATVPTVVTGNDPNRGSANIALAPEVSAEIWAKTLEESAIMQLSRQVTIPGSGLTIQTIAGEPTADWVSETNPKPLSAHTFGKKNITAYKLAVIEAFSDEFLRDKKALYDECVRRLPYALGRKFDATTTSTTAPGSNFDVLGGCTAVSLNPSEGGTVYGQFLAADAAISAGDGIMSGIALAPQGKSKVLAAVDGQGRPLFTPGVGSNTVGDILGAPVSVNKGVYRAGSAPSTPAVVGIAGDFNDAIVGVVDGVKIDISNQATLVTDDGVIALWQQNMFALRAEIEIGFAVRDAAEFVLLTGDVPSA